MPNPDRHAIEDFRGLSNNAYFSRVQNLCTESADYVRDILPAALGRYRRVVFLTHFPPHTDAVRFNGQPCGWNRMSHFANFAMGGALGNRQKLSRTQDYGLGRPFPLRGDGARGTGNRDQGRRGPPWEAGGAGSHRCRHFVRDRHECLTEFRSCFGNYALALNVFSNSAAAAIISSKVGVLPKNIGPSMAW